MSGTETSAVFRSLNGKSPTTLFGGLPTPCYIIDEAALRRNGEILSALMCRTGCKVLLAQKAFSNYDFYPLLSQYLSGTAASGLYEARLGRESMPQGEVHVFCGAYRDEEFTQLLAYADHIVFNTPRQLEKFGKLAKNCGKSVGLRINPECSTQGGRVVYDPCAPGSRLGTTRSAWDQQMTDELISLIDGLHFHTLCEQDSDALETTLLSVEEKFGDVLPRMKWLNFGGGHHITKEGYDLPRLEKWIIYAQKKWGLQVYLEPGEAVAFHAGYLASRVLDIVENGDIRIAILDASAACHMPDVIEMPYTPPIYGSVSDTKGGCHYLLGGPSCLSGDVIGAYTFDHELQEGELLLFGDMAIYTMCKNNTFNGMPLPNIWRRFESGRLDILTNFGYEDFRTRLGKIPSVSKREIP